jgi:PAS domain S-box-containing protein
MEEELRLSEERYRRLYNQTPVMLHSIDDDGRLVSVSDYWLETLGYERSEVLGRRTTEFLTESSRHYATEAILPDFFLTGSCKEVPYRFVKKNGEALDVLLSAIAERNDEGEVVRSLAVMVDVTDRKRAEEEIEQLNTDLAARAIALENANRELEAFSYSVSHDLRKPLTVISGYSQVIRETCTLVPHKQIKITLASLGPQVGLIGAAQVWHHRFERCGGRLE